MRAFKLPVFFFVVLAACAPSQRESTLKAALVTVNAARDGFLAYDENAQARIVTKATSLEDGRAQLATYRAERVKIETVFTVAYRAIAVAATLNDDPSMKGVQAAIAQVLAAVAAITGGAK